MRTASCCRSFLAYILKFLNFLQTFVGISIVIYSIWMFNQWNNRIPVSPPSAPSPDPSVTLLSNFEQVRAEPVIRMSLPMVDMVSGFDDAGIHFQIDQLPSPWFIYAFMGFGVVLCCITCIGHIAAEAHSGCCLCLYTVLKTVLILLEAALVLFITLNHHWEKDLPIDPTGELDSLRSFILRNTEICKWVGISVIVIQVLALILALILRAMVSTRREDYESDEEYDVNRSRKREPLLNPQVGQTSGSFKGDPKGNPSDIWSSRMRQKYGINGGGNASNV